MRMNRVRKSFIGAIIGFFTVTGAAVLANAQNPTDEYREWQQAQRIAQDEYQDYLRSRDRRDYINWQMAQRRAQQQYREYQMSNRTTYNAGRGRGYGYGRNRTYRVYRDGRYYETNSQGAELLRRAVNYGYQQGFQEGQNDRLRRSGYNYTDETSFRRGLYGYQSYVARDQYEYYFQEGYRRGYEDGYYSTNRYGYRTGSSFNILGNVLNSILNIAQQ